MLKRHRSGNPALSEVKIFGERNTGTRVLRTLLESIPGITVLPSTAKELDGDAYWAVQSLDQQAISREAAIDQIFEGRSPRETWKHCATEFDAIEDFGGCVILITVKNPASWLVSLRRRPYHALSKPPENLGEFLRFQWKTVRRERLKEQSFTPLKLYNAKINSYLRMIEQLRQASIPCRFLRFEDLVLNQEREFRALAALVGAQMLPFAPVEQSTKSSELRLEYYRDYYGKERWREDLVGFESAINREVEWDQLSAFGYEPV